MRFHSALISSFLLASAVLADTSITTAGAELDNGAFRIVSTDVNVPQLSGNVSDSITVAVVFQSNGKDCPNFALIGYYCNILPSSQTYCMAYSEVNGNYTEFTDFGFGPGDNVTLRLTSPSNETTQSGTHVFIQNLGTLKSLDHDFTDTACGSKPGWILSRTPSADSGFLELARFGQLDFYATEAYPLSSLEGDGPADGKPWNMADQNGHLIAIAQPKKKSMVIKDI